MNSRITNLVLIILMFLILPAKVKSLNKSDNQEVYGVQIGAYKTTSIDTLKQIAKITSEETKSDVHIHQKDSYIKIQVGGFDNKDSADALSFILAKDFPGAFPVRLNYSLNEPLAIKEQKVNKENSKQRSISSSYNLANGISRSGCPSKKNKTSNHKCETTSVIVFVIIILLFFFLVLSLSPMQLGSLIKRELRDFKKRILCIKKDTTNYWKKNSLQQIVFRSPLLHYVLRLTIGVIVFISMEGYINKKILNKAITPNCYWFLFGLIIYFVIWCFRAKWKYRIHKTYLQLFLIPISVWFCYNLLFTTNYTFSTFYHGFRYLDIIFIIVFLELILAIKLYRCTTIKENTSAFTIDKEWEDTPGEVSDEPDLLGFTTAAEVIAKELRKFHSEKAFTIGIIGRWGEGKSSLVNMIWKNFNNDVDKKSIITIKYNPWKNQKPEGIINDFFKILKAELKPYSGEISHSIKTYLKVLGAVGENKLFDITKKLLPEDPTIIEQYDLINRIIKKINKKIVIAIDDIDRLNNTEVYEVIRLVRNTANFYNTVFILAYDRSYVQNAIKAINLHNSEEYIEKIVNFEFTIPKSRSNANLDLLIDILEKNKGRIEIGEIISLLSYDLELKMPKVEEIFPNFQKFIPTLRDVKRFANKLIFNLQMVGDKVHPFNFLFLMLFEHKMPEEFQRLKNDIGSLISKDQITTSEFGAFSKIIFNQNKYLETLKEYEINNDRLGMVSDILNKIFNIYSPDENQTSIMLRGNYIPYFSFEIFNTTASEELKNSIEGFTEFLSALKAEIESLKGNQIKIEQLYESIIDELYQKFENSIDANKKTILYCLIHVVTESSTNFQINRFIKFIAEDLWFFNESIVELLDEKFKESNNPKLFCFILREVFSSYMYETNYKFPITLDKIKQYSINYLKESVGEIIESKNESIFNDDVWNIYYTCMDKIDTENGNVIVLQIEANQLFLKLIKEMPLPYLRALIRPKYSSIAPKNAEPFSSIYVFEPFINQTFTDYKSFEIFIGLPNKDHTPEVNNVIHNEEEEYLVSKGVDRYFLRAIQVCWMEYKQHNYAGFEVDESEKTILNRYITNKIQ